MFAVEGARRRLARHPAEFQDRLESSAFRLDCRYRLIP